MSLIERIGEMVRRINRKLEKSNEWLSKSMKDALDISSKNEEAVK
jgi:hypothetical protein